MQPNQIRLFHYLLLLIISSIYTPISYAQNTLIVNDIANKYIVALGDASHTDYTASKLRVDLIKELVEQHNFKIIALESNLYEVYQAFEQYKITGQIETINSAIYFNMRNKPLEELFHYLKEQNEKGNTVKVIGFDSAFSGDYSDSVFTTSITETINNSSLNCTSISPKEFEKHFKNLTITNLKALFRTKKDYNIVYDYLQCYLTQIESNPILQQALTNLTKIIDAKKNQVNSDNHRDQLMFENILTLKKLYPNEKLILFGSSTHFIRKPKAIESSFMQNNRITLGSLLANKFKDDYAFIAYTAINGNTLGFYGKKHKLKDAIPNSIEQIITLNHNTEIPFYYLYKDDKVLTQVKYTRLLGNTFQKMNIKEVIDGLVLIRDNNTEN
ncbi:erythromycin esterase family protein [Myroides sp. N17-2]|uniref:erythromycin esterase family protein n=1 Tax=Myroides sp. N17-2 TaxID=2030799 RepID=UPI000EFC0638|nr:erythromycin esterase family protein [Myroides sp. N17-2]